eukprot:7463019-Alexandrium_andersonii.AAC.1
MPAAGQRHGRAEQGQRPACSCPCPLALALRLPAARAAARAPALADAVIVLFPGVAASALLRGGRQRESSLRG